MEEPPVARCWCNMCWRTVNPIMEEDSKCPICNGVFMEEMNGEGGVDTATDPESDRHLTLVASFWLYMLHGGSSRRLRLRMQTLFRRRRSILPILQLLRALWNGHVYENRRVITRERRVQTTLSLDINPSQGRSSGVPSWDFFLGPRLDLLLQHQEETDPDTHETAPAQEAAVAAMPTVKIEEILSCPVCQEDFEIGAEAREMPCKHKFHADCILPWLTLHGSCPVCRFQMLTEESTSSSAGGNGDGIEVHGGSGDGTGGGDERGPWLPFTWPFSGLLSLLGSHRSADSSSSQPSSSSDGSNS